MIEKMQKVYIVSSVSRKESLLEELRNLGILHISEKKSASPEAIERFSSLSRTLSALADYTADKDKKNKKNKTEEKILSDAEFEELYQEALSALDQRSVLMQNKNTAASEADRVRAWGDFVPSELAELRDNGFDFHFYQMTRKDYQTVANDPDIKIIKLSSVDKMETVAVLGKLPVGISAMEFTLPDKSCSELRTYMEECDRQIAECDETLKHAALYTESFKDQLLKAQNDEIYSSAELTAENDEDFVWLSGYIPEDEINAFKDAASANGWAYMMEDVAEDDEQVPTKVRYNKVSGLIKPVFDILSISPGYREQDISLWFLLFFVVFFAMIIGDAAYGMLILIGTIILHVKMKKMNNILLLLYVLSIGTIVWGAVTGTWFGLESAMDVPLLKAMVIPGFANYPERFGVTALEQQNNIMRFSFTIGAIQMVLGSILAIRKKISEKNLSWIADLGWIIAIVCMYLLSLYLVTGDNVPILPVFVGIGIAFLLVILFSGMSPDVSFGKGMAAGLKDAFTAFLNTISCFGNVMSYIRLFAVGMAGLAISQSFNGIAAGFKGPMIVLGVIVVVIGHTLNLVMCFLSVVVHGVRLNVLEFSGQVGLEWTGVPYEPYKKNDKIQN